LAEGETAYAMIGGVENPSPTPNQILIMEVTQPQKLGEGDGRFPIEKAKFWKQKLVRERRRPADFDGLGSHHMFGINAGHRSGAARFLSEEVTSSDLLQGLFDGTAATLP
jgi:hypothetical protein